MRRTVLLLALLAGLPAMATGGTDAADRGRACTTSPQTTQGDLNACTGADARDADRELNAVYRRVLERHRDDPVFIRRLQAAQRAWIGWRDAEMKAVFPDREEPGHHGSVLPMCWSLLQERLTRERTRQLRVWLDGTAEGDVCAGTVPTRPSAATGGTRPK